LFSQLSDNAVCPLGVYQCTLVPLYTNTVIHISSTGVVMLMLYIIIVPMA